MKTFFACYLGITICSVIAVAYWFSEQSVASFAWGAAVMLANLMGLSWSWWLIFQKKLVALAASVIVFKYAILGLIIYFLIARQKVAVEWMVAGLSVLLPSIFIFAIVNHRQNRQRDEEG